MKLRFWFLLPARLWMAVLLVAPLAIVLAYSLLTRGVYGGVEKPWTLEGYQRLIDPLYLTILLRSFAMALAATALCLVFAFPAALFISRATKRKNLYLQLVMLPFWTSFLVRTYAWMFLLRDTGLINTALQKLGIIHSPLPLLYNDGAVLLGLVYGYLPFMVLPIYATLERLDPALDRGGGRSGRAPAGHVVPRHRPAFAARHRGRLGAGFHPLPGRLPDARPAGRRPHRAGGQPGAEPVHQCARLAFRLRRFRRAHGAGDFAGLGSCCVAKASPWHEALAGGICGGILCLSAPAAADPGRIQLQLFALHRVGTLFARLVPRHFSRSADWSDGTWNSVVDRPVGHRRFPP